MPLSSKRSWFSAVNLSIKILTLVFAIAAESFYIARFRPFVSGVPAPAHIAFFAAGLWLAVLVHEFGHAAVGRLVGWRPYLVIAGPFWLRLRPLALRWHRVFKIGGRTHLSPVSLQYFSKPRRVAVLAAGSLVNLLCAALIAAAAKTPGSWGLAALHDFAFVSLFLGLINLVPSRVSGGAGSDGLQILNTLTVPLPFPQRAVALATLMSQMMSGVAVPDWDAAAVKYLAGNPTDDNAGGLADLFLVDYYFETGDLAPACAAMARARVKLAALALMRDPINVAEAYIAVRAEHDAAKAQALLDSVTAAKVKRGYAFVRTGAFIVLARGERAAALKAIARARRALPRHYPFLRDYETRLLDDATKEAQALPVAEAA